MVSYHFNQVTDASPAYLHQPQEYMMLFDCVTSAWALEYGMWIQKAAPRVGPAPFPFEQDQPVA